MSQRKQSSGQNRKGNSGGRKNTSSVRRCSARLGALPYPPAHQPLRNSVKSEEPSPQTKNSGEPSTRPPKGSPMVKQPIDITSQQGKFGWTILGQDCLPYLLRDGELFISMRMIKFAISNNQFYHILHPDLYRCTNVPSCNATMKEAELLTSINTDHALEIYGKGDFTTHDQIINVKDARAFWRFIEGCYNKLIHPHAKFNHLCGFLCINKTSVVAYASRDRDRYVPLFYFEGISNSVKKYLFANDSWELAYLKFCCKIQGIRSDFLEAAESIPVVKLSDLRSNFPSGTKFEEYWFFKEARIFFNGKH